MAQARKRVAYSVRYSVFEDKVVPYLESLGKKEIREDGVRVFYTEEGGTIIAGGFDDYEIILFVHRCQPDVHSKLVDLCDE